MALSIPDVPRLRQAVTTCVPDVTLTAALAGQHYAAKVDTGVIGDLSGKPRVGMSDTNDANDTYGEYMSLDGGEVGIQTGGIMVLRTAATYTAAMNGFGVRGTTTSGVVEIATLGTGFGRIIGGGTVNIDGTDRTVFVVDGDA